jgi:hypothetical protein
LATFSTDTSGAKGEKLFGFGGTFGDPHFTMKAMDEFADDDYHKTIGGSPFLHSL